jgi:hypothetical protein
MILRGLKNGLQAVQLNVCRGGNCNPNPDDKIPRFYSEQHALDAGWMKTDNPHLLPKPGWMCPDCLAANNQKQEGSHESN